MLSRCVFTRQCRTARVRARTIGSEDSDALEDDEFRRQNLVRLFLDSLLVEEQCLRFFEPPSDLQQQFFSVLPARKKNKDIHAS